jgi:hypothetical protein
LSVIANDRGVSSKQFFDTGYDIVKKMAELTFRRFGIKNKDNVTPQFNRDKMDVAEKWADESGVYLRNLSRSLMSHISRAYSIVDTRTPARKELKKKHQTLAIGECEAIITELQLDIEVLNILPSKVELIVSLLSFERDLLVKWRKDKE